MVGVSLVTKLQISNFPQAPASRIQTEAGSWSFQVNVTRLEPGNEDLPIPLSLSPHPPPMCGRFSQSKTAEFLARAFQLAALPEWQPRYNIAPTQLVPTVVHLPEQSERQFRLLRWGLVPSWSKDLAIGARLINARAETVAEKPSFRAAFKRRRCLILADGFYEWQRQNGKKQPYYFQITDHQPFAFAGLWEHWETEETVVESCTIITTEANEVLRSLHDRMPVILPPETYDQWLHSSTPVEQLQALLHPYDPESMQSYPVSTLVNSPSHENPDCIKPL